MERGQACVGWPITSLSNRHRLRDGEHIAVGMATGMANTMANDSSSYFDLHTAVPPSSGLYPQPDQRDPRSGPVQAQNSEISTGLPRRDRRPNAGHSHEDWTQADHRQLCAIASQCLATIPDTDTPYADLADLLRTVAAKRRLTFTADQETRALDAVLTYREKQDVATARARREAFELPGSIATPDTRHRREHVDFEAVGQVIPTFCQHEPTCRGLLTCLRRGHAERGRR